MMRAGGGQSRDRWTLAKAAPSIVTQAIGIGRIGWAVALAKRRHPDLYKLRRPAIGCGQQLRFPDLPGWSATATTTIQTARNVGWTGSFRFPPQSAQYRVVHAVNDTPPEGDLQ